MSRSQPLSDRLAQLPIAVVGGGIIGLAIAWRLIRQGHKVTVFEKSSFAGEASWAGAGMLAPGGEVDQPSRFASLCCESRALYGNWVRELEQASGISIDYQECGGLTLAYSQQELESMNARAACQEKLGIQSRPVTAANIEKFWPRVRTETLAGGRFYPGDAVVNPRDVTDALVAALKTRAELIDHCAVRHLSIGRDRVLVEASGSNRAFDAAIVAAGAWSGFIPVEGIAALPGSEPVKGHLIAYGQPEQTCSTIVRHRHTYLFQRANGRLIVGASVERAGFNRDLDPERVAELARKAEYILPHLAQTAPSEAWTGFRPESSDLYIGPWDSSCLLLAYGHFRNGILLAPVTAERIASALISNLQTR